MNGSPSATGSQTPGSSSTGSSSAAGSQTAGDATTGRTAPAWLAWTGQAVSFFALCVFCLAAVVLIVVPFVTGSHTYSVLTNSMAPAYPPGTFVVIKPAEFDELQVGDVITFQIESGRPDVITHRITGLTADQDGETLLLTQGDNNDVADPDPVMEIQVRGKLFYAVPYVGFAANALGNADRSSAVTILAVALIVWGVVTMVRGVIRDRRQKRERQAAGVSVTIAHEPTAGTVLNEPVAARHAHGETQDDSAQDAPQDTSDDADAPTSGADQRSEVSMTLPGPPGQPDQSGQLGQHAREDR